MGGKRFLLQFLICCCCFIFFLCSYRSEICSARNPVKPLVNCINSSCFLRKSSSARKEYTILNGTRSVLPHEADIYLQAMEKPVEKYFIPKGSTGGPRRLLGGPGSSPPRCTSKCGRCTPCKPVHVPVPPGTPVTTEYYPEAWRCKCGNKLYLP